MKTKNFFILAATLSLSFMLVTQQACKKEINNTPKPEDAPKIAEGKVEQNISASNGGTISFDNGLKLEIPANALSADTRITIQTRRPYEEVNSGSTQRLTGSAVSQIVDCEPTGTTFSKPVKLTIPYYPELLPSGYSESDLLFLTYHNEQWDTLDIHIDRTNHLAYAYVNHFSLFKIAKQDKTNWILTDLKLGNSNSNLTLSFKNTYGASFAGFLLRNINMNYNLVQSQEIYYEINLYRKKTFGKELIAEKQIYKGLIYTQATNSVGKELIKGPQAENKSYFTFDKLPKHANLEEDCAIFHMADNQNPGKRYAAVDIVTFNQDKQVVSTQFINLKNNIPQDNDDFLSYTTTDGYKKYFEIAPLSKLESGEKYFFTIKIRSYGVINTRKFLSLSGGSEFVTSKFTLDDIGGSLDENHPPAAPSNPTPADNATKVSTTPTLKWTCTDPDNDPLDYDVYFGKTNNPELVKSNLATSTYSPDKLDYNTTYYWKIVAKDSPDDATQGTIWSFTTEKQIENSIKIISNPPGASVYLDGTNMNVITPTTLNNVNSGQHHIRLYKTGYNEYDEVFQLEEGSSYTINANLGNPLPPLPVFEINQPQNNEHFSSNVITVSGNIQLKDNQGNITSFNGSHAILTLNGVDQEIPVDNGSFNQDILIRAGKNAIQLRANSINGDTGISDELIVYGNISDPDIKIILRWNNGTSKNGEYTKMKDVDLHVYDTEGHHTYWLCSDQYSGNNEDAIANMIPGSKLDIDNTWGYGPEIFTLQNSTNTTYTVKAHFYSGYDASDPTIANIEITLKGKNGKTYGPYQFKNSYELRDSDGNYLDNTNFDDPDCWWNILSFTMKNGLPKIIKNKNIIIKSDKALKPKNYYLKQ